MKSETINLYDGIPLDVLIRIHPDISEKQNLRIFENKVTLLDDLNKPYDDFISNYKIIENQESLEDQFSNIFENNYLNQILEGNNFSIFTFGDKGSGKTYSLETKKEKEGIYEIILKKLLLALENKNYLYKNKENDPDNKNKDSLKIDFSYNVKMKFIELKEENCYDLLQKYNYFKQTAEVTYIENEGYSSVGAAYVNISNIESFLTYFNDAIVLKNNNKLEEKNSAKLFNKNSTILTLEVSQILQDPNKKINNLFTSKINIFDLPSSNILIENKPMYSSDTYKSIFSFQNLISELVKSNLTFNLNPDIYEFSKLTKLMKESIGFNSLCLGIFTLKNNNFKTSELSFKLMKQSQKILCYPLINEKFSNSILRILRNEIIHYQKEYKNLNEKLINKNSTNQNNDPLNLNTYNQKNLNKNINLDLSSDADASLLDQLKNKNYILEKEISRLENELKISEEEKIKLLNNFKNNLKHENLETASKNNSNLDNSPNQDENLDLIENDIKEQMEIMNSLNNLQEKLTMISSERRKFEEDNLNLRSAYLKQVNEIDKIQNKNMNLVNNLNNEILQLKNLLNSNQAELELMRSLKDSGTKANDGITEEYNNKMNSFQQKFDEIKNEYENKVFEASANKIKNFDNQKKEFIRKIESLSEENLQIKKINEDLAEENGKLNLQNEELRNSLKELYDMYSKRNPEISLNDKKQNNKNVGILKESFIEVFNKREFDLKQNLNLETSKNKNLDDTNKKMRIMLRKLRNLALDYYPDSSNIINNSQNENSEFSKILFDDVDKLIENQENEGIIQFFEYEIKELRKRLKLIENENFKIKNQNVENIEGNLNKFSEKENKNYEQNIQRKILDEIEKLKINNRPNTSYQNKELEKYKLENSNLKDEIIKMKRQIVSLNKNNSYNYDNEGNITDYSQNEKVIKNFQIKIDYMEKMITKLEKEKIELKIKSKVAEEQLASLQKYLNNANRIKNN